MFRIGFSHILTTRGKKKKSVIAKKKLILTTLILFLAIAKLTTAEGIHWGKLKRRLVGYSAQKKIIYILYKYCIWSEFIFPLT